MHSKSGPAFVIHARARPLPIKLYSRTETASPERSRSLSDKSLLIKTEFAGEVTVQWPAVEDIKSEQQLHVGLKDGRTLVGPVTTSDGSITISTKTGGSVEALRENVVVMRSDAEQLAWEKKQHPGLLEGWGLNFGFGLTRGNSQTKTLAIAFNGTARACTIS